MFRNLPSYEPSNATLDACLERMSEAPPPAEMDNPTIAAGYTYLGQFIDHDLTFDPVSSLDRQNDPDALTSFRSPSLDLDSVYGSGRDDQPYLYDPDDDAKLRLGRGENEQVVEHDLPRVFPLPAEGGNPRRDGVALIGDPRNDENIIVSQLHLAFLKLHNRVVDDIRADGAGAVDLRPHVWGTGNVFREAQRLTRWHYQWIVLTDFLPKVLGQETFNRMVTTTAAGALTLRQVAPRQFYKPDTAPYIPVEWSVGAYRFGHSQIRPTYNLNDVVRDVAIFIKTPKENNRLTHLAGGRQLPPVWSVDWRFFFDQPAEADAPAPQPVPENHWVGPPVPPPQPDDPFRFRQLSRRIDTALAAGLEHLPGIDNGSRFLAERNLLRGRAMGLPSGQAVARRLGVVPPETELLAALPGEAPLWYYVLAEAQALHQGQHLGPVGGSVVGEVILGLLADDPFSFLRTEPGWQPVLPAGVSGHAQAWGIADMLDYAVPDDGRRFARA